MSVSCSDCFSDLLCGEDSSIIFSTGGEDLPECSSDQDFLVPEVQESIAGLIENERDFMFPCSDYIEKFHSTQSIDASNRADSVAWILKAHFSMADGAIMCRGGVNKRFLVVTKIGDETVHRYYGFQPLTAYLSVNYFDRFLYSHRLPKMNGWPVQLLSVACLSLAAKMEEPLVPSLLDLQVEGAKIIFEPRNIQRMELLVLRVLDWRLQSISPFSFLSFFAHKIDPTGTYTGFLTSRATEIILSNIQETNFLEYRPSCIAAATILCAANDLPHLSLVTAQHAESWCDGLHKDKIISCHQLMQQTAFANRPRKQPKVLPQLRVMTRASITWSDSSSTSFSSSSPYKRRKLNNSLWLDNDK